MSNFWARTLTGIVFVGVIIGSAMFDVWAFAGVFAVFTFFGILEFYKLVSKHGIKPNVVIGALTGMAVYAINVLNITGIIETHVELYYLAVFACLSLVFFIEMFHISDIPFHNIAYTFLGVIYVVIPFTLLVNLSVYAKASIGLLTFPILYFFIMWANDTFAYLVGISIGKNRLFERISPKKSWEGAIGGLVFACGFAFLLSYFYSFMSVWQWLGLACIIVVFGTLGDLAESMFKRSIGCKDSGNFLPGHGGILDRFDSILLSVPFVFIYLQIIAIYN